MAKDSKESMNHEIFRSLLAKKRLFALKLFKVQYPKRISGTNDPKTTINVAHILSENKKMIFKKIATDFLPPVILNSNESLTNYSTIFPARL